MKCRISEIKANQGTFFFQGSKSVVIISVDFSFFSFRYAKIMERDNIKLRKSIAQCSFGGPEI